MRIAILTPPADAPRRELAGRLAADAMRRGVAVEILHCAAGLREKSFAFVLTLTSLQPKLTACPSYAVFERADLSAGPVGEVLARVLGHDGYLIPRTDDRRFLEDLLFGCRKWDSPVLDLPVVVPSVAVPSLDGFSAEPGLKPVLFVAMAAAPVPKHREVYRTLLQRWAVRFVALDQDVARAAEEVGLAVETIPADGVSLAREAAGCCAALCLKPQGGSVIAYDVILGALIASGRPVLTDGDPFNRLDGDAPASVLVRQIERCLAAPASVESTPAGGVSAMDLLFAAQADTLVRKGYVPNPTDNELPAVSYIVRAGGRPGRYLRRTLTSLAIQRYPKLKVVVVLWRETEEETALLQQDWGFTLDIMRLPGASRSKTLAAGLGAVKEGGAELFGILDDDDELHPNHIRSLVGVLRRRRALALPPPGVVYSGTVEVSEHGFERLAWETLPLPLPAGRVRPGAFFFPNPRRLWSAGMTLPPNAFLACTSLIDEEVLSDSELPVAEDTFLLNLLSERTSFAFSSEVTAVYHFHGMGQSNWWKQPDIRSVTERLTLRFLSHSRVQEAAYNGYPHPPLDDRLGIPLPIAPVMDDPCSVVAEGDVEVMEGGSLATAATVRLPVGQYTVTWYVQGALVGGQLVGPVVLRLISSHGTSPRGGLSHGDDVDLDFLEVQTSGPNLRLSHGLTISVNRDDPYRLCLAMPGDFALQGIGFQVVEAELGLFVPWSELPSSARIWIFGAGSAGRAAFVQLGQLGLTDRVVGFLDNRQSGATLGLPILHPDILKEGATSADLVLIASQDWRDIARQLKNGRRGGVYCTHPINTLGLRFLG